MSDIIALYDFLKGSCSGVGLSSQVTFLTRRRVLRLHKRRFRLDIKMVFFTERVLKHLEQAAQRTGDLLSPGDI